MFQIIVEERKRREVDPTIAMLKGCEAELAQTNPADSYTAERIAEMTGFFETTTALYRELNRLPAGAVRQAFKLKSRWKKLLSGQASKDYRRAGFQSAPQSYSNAARKVFLNCAGSASRATVTLGRALTSFVRPSSGGLRRTSIESCLAVTTAGSTKATAASGSQAK